MMHIIYCLLWSVAYMSAGSIGSSTAVNRYNIQITLPNGSTVQEFPALLGGFLVQTSTSSVTWETVFETSGLLDLNGGTLNLVTDVRTSNIVTLNSLGTINGNGYAFEFAPTLTSFVGACSLTITSSASGLSASSGPTFWSFNDNFVSIASTANISTLRFNGTTLAAPANLAITSFNGAHIWHPSANFIVVNNAAGTMTVYSVNAVTGVLTSVSSLASTPANPRTFAWHPTGFYIASGGSGTIGLYPVNASGTLSAPVVVAGIPSGVNSLDWAVTGTYLAAATESTDNGLRIYALGGTALAPTLTSLLYQNTGFQGRAVRWNPQYSDVVAIGFGPVSGTNAQVYRYNAGANTLTLLTSTTGPRVFSIDWSKDGSCLMLGAEGVIVLYAFDNTTGSLGLCCQYAATNSVQTRYSPVNNYVSQAISAGSSILNVYLQAAKTGTFNNLNIILNNNLSLQNCLLNFSGDCSLIGNGFTVDMDRTATIAVANNSVLRLKDITLSGLQEGSIRMVGAASNLILEDAALVLDGNYTFTQGSCTFTNQNSIAGQNKQFIYTSTLQSVIQSQSSLYLDTDLTFSYDPRSSSNALLQFVDNSSELILHGATLAASYTGLLLTKGTLVAERHAYIQSGARVAAEGIQFGSGISANNMQIKVAPAAVLEVTSGYVVNNNV